MELFIIYLAIINNNDGRYSKKYINTGYCLNAEHDIDSAITSLEESL